MVTTDTQHAEFNYKLHACTGFHLGCIAEVGKGGGAGEEKRYRHTHIVMQVSSW